MSTVSSWKLDASTTQTPPASAAGVPTASASGSPRLPPTNVGRPVARMMSPTSVVVVDLPLVPVIAISVLDTNRDASSISPVTVTPAARAAASSGISGTPGDSTISSAPVNVASRCPPSSRATSTGSSPSAPPNALASRLSVTVTCAPRAAHSFAAAIPERPRPTTSTRLLVRLGGAPCILTTRLADFEDRDQP